MAAPGFGTLVGLMSQQGARTRRERRSTLLEGCRWELQDRDEKSMAMPAVAVREFKLERGHGYADYLLFVDGQAVVVARRRRPPLGAD